MRPTAKVSVVPYSYDHFSTTYDGKFCLNRCQCFRVTKDLVPDIMHDIILVGILLYHNIIITVF